MPITFAGYTFTFDVLTIVNRYIPENLETISAGESLIVRSTSFSYGEGAGQTTGAFEVRFTATADGIQWQARARHSEPITGIRARIGLLPGGKVRIPLNEIVEIKEGDPGRCYVYPGGYYPLRHVSSTGASPHAGPLPIWAAQFAVFEAGDHRLFLSARDYPPRVKKLWLYHEDGGIEAVLYDEADACRRAQEFETSAWRLQNINAWQPAVIDYAQWMAQAFGMQPFAQHAELQPWMRQLQLVAILHGMAHDGKIGFRFSQMADCLEALARLHPPGRTLVKLVGFEGPIDRRWPTVDPAPELGGDADFDALVATAHRLGFHLMPHLNVWGASFEHPDTQKLLPYQIVEISGRPATWSFDYNQDEIAEEIMAYISPDTEAWRALQVERVGKLVARGMDAIYLDQTGTFINDLRHDHFRGLRALYHDLYQAFPHTQFAGEAPTQEVTACLCSLVCGISTLANEEMSEMYRLLFGAYIRQYGYNEPPEPYRGVWGPPDVTRRWSRERFVQYEERSARVNGIPTLNLTDHRIRLDGELVSQVLERARSYQIERKHVYGTVAG